MSRALDEFQLRLLEFEADFRFVSLAARLRPRLGSIVDWKATGESVGLAQEFMNVKEYRIENVFGSCLVRLSAMFERFVRGLIEDLIDKYATAAPTYDQLGEHLRLRNTALTGMLLASIESPRGHISLQYDSLIRNLASCHPGSTEYQLNGLAFASVVIGSGAAAVEKALANLGLQNWWDKIGANTSLGEVLGTRGARATGKAARDRLEELSRWRNHLAHAGDEEVALSEADLRSCIKFLASFAAALDEVVFSSR